MYLTIVLRKEVPDTSTAQNLVDVVAEKLNDHPEIEVSGSCSEQMTPTPPD